MASSRRRLGATGVLLLAVLAVAPAAAPAATKTTLRLGSHTMINPTMDPAAVNGLFKASRDADLGTVRLDVLVSSIFPSHRSCPTGRASTSCAPRRATTTCR